MSYLEQYAVGGACGYSTSPTTNHQDNLHVGIGSHDNIFETFVYFNFSFVSGTRIDQAIVDLVQYDSDDDWINTGAYIVVAPCDTSIPIGSVTYNNKPAPNLSYMGLPNPQYIIGTPTVRSFDVTAAVAAGYKGFKYWHTAPSSSCTKSFMSVVDGGTTMPKIRIWYTENDLYVVKNGVITEARADLMPYVVKDGAIQAVSSVKVIKNGVVSSLMVKP